MLNLFSYSCTTCLMQHTSVGGVVRSPTSTHPSDLWSAVTHSSTHQSDLWSTRWKVGQYHQLSSDRPNNPYTYIYTRTYPYCEYTKEFFSTLPYLIWLFLNLNRAIKLELLQQDMGQVRSMVYPKLSIRCAFIHIKNHCEIIEKICCFYEFVQLNIMRNFRNFMLAHNLQIIN